MDTSGRSKLNGNKKSQIYKAIIEHIWEYRLQIWSTSTKVEYLIRETLKIPTVEREITNRANAQLSRIKKHVWLKTATQTSPKDSTESIRLIYSCVANNTHQYAGHWFILDKSSGIDPLNTSNLKKCN